MAKITYKHPDGTVTIVDVPTGRSVMRGAVTNNIDGILAECGGDAQCGTCHVYIDEGNTIPLPPVLDYEDELLNSIAGRRRPHSRLACQIPVSDALDGLVVHMPEEQV
ncbi:MAG TPA: 2Fe-2S iron-sulfur cluster-binding protein [Candidatus Limnocylindrales bacterium]|nr:2Fe-2S iron-sulfur cluster-binding protein [Candidatus Limnocylindrales bacterium]